MVCSLKEGYGFIERADVVREIFFHYSEYKDDIATAILGEDVEFAVQTRNVRHITLNMKLLSVHLVVFWFQGKDVAVEICKLPEGTVVFEDVAIERRRGRIVKTLKALRGRKSSDPLAGRIVYETVDG